jgi:hypothetical protein
LLAPQYVLRECLNSGKRSVLQQRPCCVLLGDEGLGAVEAQ